MSTKHSRRKGNKSSRHAARTPVDHDKRVAAAARTMTKALGYSTDGMEVNIKVGKNGAEIQIKKPLTGLRKQWDRWVVQPYEAFNKLTVSTTGALVITGAVLATALGQSTTSAEAGYTQNEAVMDTGKEVAGEVLKARFGAVGGTVINAFIKAVYPAQDAPVKKAEAKAKPQAAPKALP